MSQPRRLLLLFMVLLFLAAARSQHGDAFSAQRDEAAPSPVKLVFIHHSCGENWLADRNGGLGQALSLQGFFVSDTNYGWGPNSIGDRTDITDWPEWFVGPNSERYLQALFRESGQHSEYTRSLSDPGGENQVIMFKSCFPNSQLGGAANDAAKRGGGLTVGNAKAIYNELLACFLRRPDKLFVVITAPPVQDPTLAANARAFNTWLVRDWLKDYRGQNVVVFDFYNVLTHPDNHHRLVNGRVEYVNDRGGDTLFYDSDGDDHPSMAGNRKATMEFAPLLKYFYRKWAATVPPSNTVARSSPRTTARPQTSPATSPDPNSLLPASSSDRVLDRFDEQRSAWRVFVDEEKEARVSCERDEQIKQAGAGALRVSYDVPAESWGTCSLIYDAPQDWSAYAGIVLQVRAERLGQTITILVYGGSSADELLHFEHHLTAGAEMVGKWREVTIAWDQFRLPSWQGDESRRFDPQSAMGVAVAFASERERLTGRIWLDEIRLSARNSR